jgi:hypothetical protein
VKYKSLKGKTTLAPILKIGKKSGTPWCEFALLLEDGNVAKCLAFNELAERLCSTVKDNCALTCLGMEQSDGSYFLNSFNAPKLGHCAVKNYKTAERPSSQMDVLCDTLGAAYVNQRLRAWIKTWDVKNLINSGAHGQLTKLGKGFDVQGYKEIVAELEAEIAAVNNNTE